MTFQPKSHRLGPTQQIAYGMGGVSNFFMGNLLASVAMLIFSDGIGISAWKVGMALAMPRICDAFIDLYIGHLSDSWKGRWGRRRPFMFVGTITATVTFALIWLPTSAWHPTVTFWWFMVLAFLFYVAFSLFSIPYMSLGYEIAVDSRERTQLTTVRTFMCQLFGLLLPWYYAMCFWNWSALGQEGSFLTRLAALIVSPEGKTLHPPGYQIVGALFALLMGVCGAAALFCRENPEVKTPEKHDFIKSMGMAFRNRPFVLLTGALVFAMIGIWTVQGMTTYINIYHVFGGDKSKAGNWTGIVGSIQTGISLVMVPILGLLISRFGASRLMKLFLVITALSFASSYWAYTPVNPWLQLIPLLLWAFGWTGVMLSMTVMIGDICDYDEFESGVRREGIYGAINQFITKLGNGLAMVISGLLVSSSGIDKAASIQPADAVWVLRVQFAVVPLIIIVLASTIFFFYPLTDRRANEIRESIKARKTGRDPETATLQGESEAP